MHTYTYENQMKPPLHQKLLAFHQQSKKNFFFKTTHKLDEFFRNFHIIQLLFRYIFIEQIDCLSTMFNEIFFMLFFLLNDQSTPSTSNPTHTTDCFYFTMYIVARIIGSVYILTWNETSVLLEFSLNLSNAVTHQVDLCYEIVESLSHSCKEISYLAHFFNKTFFLNLVTLVNIIWRMPLSYIHLQ